MRNTRNWKHTTKNEKQYGKRNTVKYETPFMVLDTKYLKEEGDENEKNLYSQN